jgi:hypothetical protein
MLSLSDGQLRLVMQAAWLIAPHQRDDFLHHLAAQLEGVDLTDAQVILTLCETLGQRGVAIGKSFFENGRGGRHGGALAAGKA